MKDWHIKQVGLSTCLRHSCHWRGLAMRKSTGEWFCPLCKVYAPEAICFAAELAGCSRFEGLADGRDTGPAFKL